MEIVTSVMIRLKSMKEKKEMVTQELQVVQVEWDGSTRKMCEQEGNELNFNFYAKKKKLRFWRMEIQIFPLLNTQAYN